MEPRLTPDQLSKIVREVELISQRDQDNLSQDQVRQILDELGLPPVLLEDAMVQVQRRDALERQQQQRKWLLIGGAALGTVAIVTAIGLNQNSQNALANVTAQSDRLTLAQDNGSRLSSIDRTGTELYYRVTLTNAPIGEKLPLSCTWTDSQGQVVKENQYQTKPIKTSTWNTQCRTTIGPSANPGSWKVNMKLNGRSISDEGFDVRP
jgi:hypothetical protein